MAIPWEGHGGPGYVSLGHIPCLEAIKYKMWEEDRVIRRETKCTSEGCYGFVSLF